MSPERDPAPPPPLARLASLLARLALRWVPDSFSIAALLTLAAFGLGMGPGGASPRACLTAWGGGVWSLLAFSMQMVVIIFAGYVLAVSPPATRLLDRWARLPGSPAQAVASTALLSMLLCWIHWGVGMIAAAVAVRRIAARQPGTDYRLLVAAAYLGMGTTWHGGLSGSAPLLVATPDSFLIRDGLLAAPIPLSRTVFTPANLALMLVVTAALTLLAARLHPAPGDALPAPREVREESDPPPPARPAHPTPAERITHARFLNLMIGGAGLVYLALEGRGLGASFDTVNLAFLSLAILLHPSPASLGRAAEAASRPLHGVVLQFPLYAGIYGIVSGTGLTEVLAESFTAVASPASFPLVVFAFTGALNYFVPSGGGQWVIQAPYLLQAGEALGVPAETVTMAFAYGDMSTNLIQPFWAIPVLAVAGIEFRDILGFTLPMFALGAALVSVFLVLV